MIVRYGEDAETNSSSMLFWCGGVVEGGGDDFETSSGKILVVRGEGAVVVVDCRGRALGCCLVSLVACSCVVAFAGSMEMEMVLRYACQVPSQPGNRQPARDFKTIRYQVGFNFHSKSKRGITQKCDL